tara:strand:+ start:25 stop:1098 length:1074 start_codon:yes stop_codon:yes gene_type:complete
MAFLDNSGDIILDAVLTDTGRMRLAQGDGSFKIAKFALGDDEINYAVYDSNHASGSAYYDLEILQTPVLEAFTNNASSLNNRLMSISRTNILYMPVLLLNKISTAGTNLDTNSPDSISQNLPSQMYKHSPDGDLANAVGMQKFVIAVDDFTRSVLFGDPSGVVKDTHIEGVVDGSQMASLHGASSLIRIDQGFDTNAVPPTLGIDSDLYESSYIIELDYRLGRLRPPTSVGSKAVNFIDDDNMASYFVSDPTYIQANTQTGQKEDVSGTDPQVFQGPRGSVIQFGLNASQELQSSTYLFQQIGSSETIAANTHGLPTTANTADGTTIVYYIDSTVRVIGATTGYRLDVPVRYLKCAK